MRNCNILILKFSWFCVSGNELDLNEKCDEDYDRCKAGLVCTEQEDDEICDDVVDHDCCRPIGKQCVDTAIEHGQV